MSCDLTIKCRTCLCDSPKFHQLSDYVYENYKILEMLDGIVPQIDIKKSTSSNYSSLVCQSCVDKLVTGYKFQKLCIETHKRLHDLMGFSIFETASLTRDASFKMKIEVKDEACFESEIYPEELEERSDDNDRDWGPGLNTDNLTDSSNEKLSVLNERKVQKSSSKSDEIETELDMEKVSTDIVKEETKLTPQIFSDCMDELDTNAEWLNNDYDDSDDNSEKKAFTKHIKNTDFIDTGVGEIEKPNKISGNFPCEVCGKVFDRPYSLRRHSSVHSITRQHECKICKYRFDRVNTLKTHMIQHDGDGFGILVPQSCPEGFKCPDCPKRFEKQASLSAHRQIHTRNQAEANYPCRVCQRFFMSAKSLTEHITNKHPEVEIHKCEQCDKTFVLRALLVEHLNKHKGNKNLVCLICEKEFGNTNSLKQHMRTHNGKNSYLCPQCGKTFRRASSLRQHMERHTGLKKYQCPECPSRFNCRQDLMRHTSTHSNANPHVCDICGSHFTRATSLRKHQILHSGERQFKCGQCSMSFTISHHLRRHMRTHTGEKPHKCKYCERAYAHSEKLAKHLRSHVGENTYICDQCPMSFKYQAELRLHQSEHYKMAQNLLPQAQKLSDKEQQHEISEQAQHHQQQLLPIDNHNQQIIIADQNHHLTIGAPNHQQMPLVDHHSQQLPTIVEQTQPLSDMKEAARQDNIDIKNLVS